ncbi:MAG: zinc ribbon domain-containing protein [Cyanobacteria bacterium J06648_11]
MNESEKRPMAGETLAGYALRLRHELGMTQKEVATKAGIHVQSVGKLERGGTDRLNAKSRRGLAYALQVPEEHFDDLAKGREVQVSTALKYCPQCWQPGTPPDAMWMSDRAKFCFACGTQLRDRCISCDEPISSLKHRFCPYCGTAYKANSPS